MSVYSPEYLISSPVSLKVSSILPEPEPDLTARTVAPLSTTVSAARYCFPNHADALCSR